MPLQYEANKMHSEALNSYNLLIGSKIYVNNGKLQANVGNIHYEMGNYEKAIKFYKMALDTVIKPSDLTLQWGTSINGGRLTGEL